MIRSGQISLDDDSKDVEEAVAPSIDPPLQSLNHVELNKLPASDLSNLSGAAADVLMLRNTVVPIDLLLLLTPRTVYRSSVRPGCPGCIDRIVVDISGCKLVR